jgi:hypothetical protein
VALMLSACSGEGRWMGTVRDSVGVTIVENTLQSIWSVDDQWTLEEELKIGAIEGDPDYQFGAIGFIAVDSQDRMYVMDAQAQHIKVFSADGRYEQTVGGPGAGPGELGVGAISLFMGPGDTLLVPDLGNQRINRYASDGTSLGSFRLEIEKGIPMAINATRSGVIAEQVRPLALPDQPVRDTMDAIVRLSMDGAAMDTLKKFPSGGTINLGGSAPELNFFSPEPVWQLMEDMRLCFGINDDYSIEMYSPDGVLERIVRKPFTRTPVTDGDKGRMLDAMVELWTAAGVPPQAIPRLRQIVHFGDYYPAFASIQRGPGGTMWVQHMQSPSTLGEEELAEFNLIEDLGARDWDVFDPIGRFLGVVTMPHRFSPRSIVGNKIYGVWRDDLDVQYAMRLRIVGVQFDDTGAIQLGAMP